MSKINTIIPPANFELILNQLGAVLVTELVTQYQLTYESIFDTVEIFKERMVTPNESECPLINIYLDAGEFKGQTQGQSNGEYRFHFMIYCQRNETDADRADQLARLDLHKLMAAVRYIFEAPAYRTLGFNAPSIMNRHFEDLAIAHHGPEDTMNVAVGRLCLYVKVAEGNQLSGGIPIGGSNTSVMIENTEQGFKWIVNS